MSTATDRAKRMSSAGVKYNQPHGMHRLVLGAYVCILDRRGRGSLHFHALHADKAWPMVICDEETAFPDGDNNERARIKALANAAQRWGESHGGSRYGYWRDNPDLEAVLDLMVACLQELQAIPPVVWAKESLQRRIAKHEREVQDAQAQLDEARAALGAL